jgi:hypothetical protein
VLVKRYDLWERGDGSLTELPDGEYVTYEEAQAELKIQDDANEILTRDLAALRTEFESVRAERVQLETIAASRADEIHRLNNRLTAANLERDALKREIAADLRKRAAWLDERSAEKYYVIPAAQANECRYLADRIEKGFTV